MRRSLQILVQCEGFEAIESSGAAGPLKWIVHRLIVPCLRATIGPIRRYMIYTGRRGAMIAKIPKTIRVVEFNIMSSPYCRLAVACFEPS